MNHKSDGDTNCIRCTRYSHQMIGKRTGGIGKKQHEWRPSKLQHFIDQPEY